ICLLLSNFSIKVERCRRTNILNSTRSGTVAVSIMKRRNARRKAVSLT
ncbi:hypothetical protein TNIN_385801, partial [Trichonephila inaurata madagascariensis]